MIKLTKYFHPKTRKPLRWIQNDVNWLFSVQTTVICIVSINNNLLGCYCVGVTVIYELWLWLDLGGNKVIRVKMISQSSTQKCNVRYGFGLIINQLLFWLLQCIRHNETEHFLFHFNQPWGYQFRTAHMLN